MSYIYYPGCSLKSTGRAYEDSLLAVFEALDIPLQELEDWNCCGATAYMSISELKAFALSARNFALAERQNGENDFAEMVVPCAACYLGLNKAHRYLAEHPELRETIDRALEAGGLKYNDKIHVRHPLDVLINDLTPDKITGLVKRPLEGLKVACYYGCQLVRPYSDFDDQHDPQTMDKIVKMLGGEVVNWPLKTRCCGGSLTGIVQDVGLRLSYILLAEARKRGCDLIVTACPLCQFNLECYQSRISGIYGHKIKIPVIYFTQLMGHAFGLSDEMLGLKRVFVSPARAFSKAEGGQHVHG
ncbi:MAG: CoB--CoM heterodisulfide reductase iron-sulfur subunit B family protein [candidate division Zixibacteria bacterium]|nr:CoB--CoM heterodisulfide reductase iron-sulfur subunit B family protein [candidate division Zixibacteria bacterium]